MNTNKYNIFSSYWGTFRPHFNTRFIIS